MTKKIKKEKCPKRGQQPKYRPEFCAAMIEFGKAGMSKATAAVQLGVCRDTFPNWVNEHPEFAEAMALFEQHSLSWWEEQGRINLMEEPCAAKFNHVLWYMNMKNKHGWADKQEIKADVSVDIAERLQRAIDRANAETAR